MKFTQENIDPSKMSAAQFRSIAGQQPLVYAYAQKIIAEASATVDKAGAPSADGERTDRIYDKIDEVLHERLQDPALVKTVMQQAGVYGAMHEHFTKLAAEKEDRKLLDALSMTHDVPRAHLVQFKEGAVFPNSDGDVTYAAHGKMPIRFTADADFIKWASDEGISPAQTEKALEVVNATRKLANMSDVHETPAAAEVRIGSMMPRAEWEHARAEVSNPGQKNGKVFLPKTLNDYSGRIIFMTDTHLVQRVGPNAAVIHDLSKLENGQALAKAFDNKEIGPRSNLHVRYGREHGVGEIVPFNVHIAREMRVNAIAWAENKIPNERTRSAFIKHHDAFTQDLIKGYAPQQAKPAITARAPDRAPQLERRH